MLKQGWGTHFVQECGNVVVLLGVKQLQRTEPGSASPRVCATRCMVLACVKIPRLQTSLRGDSPLLRLRAVPGAEGFIWPDLLHQLGETFLVWQLFVPSQRDSALACERLTLLASDQMHLFSVLIMAFVSFNILLFSKVLF